MKDCIRIDMGKNWLIVEPNVDPTFDKEVSIYLEEKETGTVIQDIAMVRPSYSWENDTPIFDNNNVDVLVYGSVESEDYTDWFKIPVWKEENN